MPVNLISPRAGQKVIVTGLIINTNRAVQNEALVKVYETDAIDSSTPLTDGEIMTFDIPKSQTVIIPLTSFIETRQGAYINAVADDSTVNVTMLCYFTEIDHHGD